MTRVGWLVARLLGVRVIESPEALRITVPRWLLKLSPGLLEGTRRKIDRSHPATDVRVVGRSIIARIR